MHVCRYLPYPLHAPPPNPLRPLAQSGDLVTVNLTTVDAFVTSWGIRFVDVMKIDTEVRAARTQSLGGGGGGGSRRD